MYNNENEQNQNNYEYHYSYRPESGSFQPEQAPAVRSVKKHGRAKKIVAWTLCGALLLGGAFGAGWWWNNRNAAQPDAPASGAAAGDTQTGDDGLQISGREPDEAVPAVSVTNGKKLTYAEVYEANIDSCVSINTSGTATVGYNIFGQVIQSPIASAGSGFVLTKDGYIATNCHVIDDADSVQVTLNDGTSYEAEIIGSDADYDIAILKVDPGDTELKPVTVGTSSALHVGEEVSTIGNPLGQLTFSMSRGMVSCINREINLNGTPFNMIQIDTSINPGNSGGPLFNSYGEVVGIVTAKTTSDGSGNAAEGLGFAIPIDDVLSMLKDIMENGAVTTRAYLGVTPADAAQMANSGARSGAYIQIVEGGPAEKAGLKTGDVITMIDTTTITSASDLRSAIGSKNYKAGDTAKVTYIRDGQVYNTMVTFGSTTEMPETEEPAQQPEAENPYSNGGTYGGSMEDFFNQFFGGYGYSQQAA